MNDDRVPPEKLIRHDTVKRVDLEGNVLNTYQREGELNGWKESQHELFPRDKYRKAPEPPKGQERLL